MESTQRVDPIYARQPPGGLPGVHPEALHPVGTVALAEGVEPAARADRAQRPDHGAEEQAVVRVQRAGVVVPAAAQQRVARVHSHAVVPAEARRLCRRAGERIALRVDPDEAAGVGGAAAALHVLAVRAAETVQAEVEVRALLGGG